MPKRARGWANFFNAKQQIATFAALLAVTESSERRVLGVQVGAAVLPHPDGRLLQRRPRRLWAGGRHLRRDARPREVRPRLRFRPLVGRLHLHSRVWTSASRAHSAPEHETGRSVA